jgi:hypothetical protein
MYAMHPIKRQKTKIHAIVLQHFLEEFTDSDSVESGIVSVISILKTSLFSSRIGLIKDNLFCIYVISSGSNIYIFY